MNNILLIIIIVLFTIFIVLPWLVGVITKMVIIGRIRGTLAALKEINEQQINNPKKKETRNDG